MIWAIYALVDPRDRSVRYVGMTKDVYQRFVDHIQCSGNNYAKNAWIAELKAANKMVIMKTLEEAPTCELALEKESYWIRYFEKLGEPIFNVAGRISPTSSIVEGSTQASVVAILRHFGKRLRKGEDPASVRRELNALLNRE